MSKTDTPAKVASTDELGQAPERAAFEGWFSENGQHPSAVERSHASYKLAAAQAAWAAWQAAVAAERERCAKLCEQWDATHPARLAAEIRGPNEKGNRPA